MGGGVSKKAVDSAHASIESDGKLAVEKLVARAQECGYSFWSPTRLKALVAIFEQDRTYHLPPSQKQVTREKPARGM